MKNAFYILLSIVVLTLTAFFIGGRLHYKRSLMKLDEFFQTNSFNLDKNQIVWISMSDFKVPIIQECLDEYINLTESYFNTGRQEFGYTNTWVINLLVRTGENSVKYEVIVPVFRRDTLDENSYLDHFGDTVRVQASKLEELLCSVELTRQKHGVYKSIKCEVADDWGYYGVFDHVRGLAYVVDVCDYSVQRQSIFETEIP